jgi:hypothetical protein
VPSIQPVRGVALGKAKPVGESVHKFQIVHEFTCLELWALLLCTILLHNDGDCDVIGLCACFD